MTHDVIVIGPGGTGSAAASHEAAHQADLATGRTDHPIALLDPARPALAGASPRTTSPLPPSPAEVIA